MVGQGEHRQHSAATLVDRYGIPASGVRDVLVDYFSEIKSGMDYGSLQGLAYRIAPLYWWEVLQINPDQQDLRLDPATAATWRERLSITTDGLPRREIHSTLFAVRGFYRDLTERSHDAPIRWGTWVAPCPVPRRESKLASKVRCEQKSRAPDRTRMLTPLPPASSPRRHAARTGPSGSTRQPWPPEQVRRSPSTARCFAGQTRAPARNAMSLASSGPSWRHLLHPGWRSVVSTAL
jgi:hypothetical protein